MTRALHERIDRLEARLGDLEADREPAPEPALTATPADFAAADTGDGDTAPGGTEPPGRAAYDHPPVTDEGATDADDDDR